MFKRLNLPKVFRCSVNTMTQFSDEPPRKTVLFDFHVQNQGRMVNFGGFLLPVVYGSENISESHLHTRKKCSLFDVSHMLQTEIYGNDRIKFLESLCTTDVEGMGVDTCALSLFTDEKSGGILDDFIITKCRDRLLLVSNASRRKHDKKLLQTRQEEMTASGHQVQTRFYDPEEMSLIALQGPKSIDVLQALVEGQLLLRGMRFMSSAQVDVGGHIIRVTRCGYTGEDGFEISTSSNDVGAITKLLLNHPDVRLAGLGARDTLRLEAGLCLYGNDIDKNTTPVSAALMWTIGKRRRELMNFPGAQPILKELQEGPQTRRVGLISTSRAPPARQGCIIHDLEGNFVGRVTSGCPSPSLNANVAMAYVKTELSKPDTALTATVRGSEVPVKVVKLPFVKTGHVTVKS